MSDPGLEERKTLVRRFVESTNRGDYDALDELVRSDFTRHSQSTPNVTVESREEFKQFLRADSATFPDSRVTIRLMVAEGIHVAILGEFTGTQDGPMGPFPATGESVAVDMSGIFRIEGGRIAELWVLWDNVALLAQLGHLSPPGE